MTQRVWDPYLTAQDHEHLRNHRSAPRPLGESPALILIDLYRWVFGDRPEPLLEAIQTWPGSCGLAAWEALPRISTVLEAARAASIPVIHVTGLTGVPRGRWSQTRSPQSGTVQGDDEFKARSLRAYDIVDEVAPLPDELVLRKAAPSAFWGTPLAGHLNYLGVDTLLVVGESTSGCVRATVVDGASYRFNVGLIEECVFDRHEAAHAMSLFDMSQKYARLMSLDEATGYLSDLTVP